MQKTEELRRAYHNHFGVDIDDVSQVENFLKWWRTTHHVHGFVGIGTSGKYYYEVWKWKGGSLGWEQIVHCITDGEYDEVRIEYLFEFLELFKKVK